VHHASWRSLHQLELAMLYQPALILCKTIRAFVFQFPSASQLSFLLRVVIPTFPLSFRPQGGICLYQGTTSSRATLCTTADVAPIGRNYHQPSLVRFTESKGSPSRVARTPPSSRRDSRAKLGRRYGDQCTISCAILSSPQTRRISPSPLIPWQI
jgi:hypothetical protein